MDDLELLFDLHGGGERQGPGGEDETRLAITLSGLRGQRGLKIADIGCGTGASTLVLARELDAHITAVDLLAGFLRRVDETARREGLGARIDTLAVSMDELPFDDGSFDAIWSEGAIYTIGFENGIQRWRRFLKPGGVLAVSELTWLTAQRPAELHDHWTAEYPEVASAGVKLSQLENHGYMPLGYFPLPRACWLDTYYRPMQGRFESFLERHGRSAVAQAVVAAEQAEISLYERYSDFVSYGYYVARRLPD